MLFIFLWQTIISWLLISEAITVVFMIFSGWFVNTMSINVSLCSIVVVAFQPFGSVPEALKSLSVQGDCYDLNNYNLNYLLLKYLYFCDLFSILINLSWETLLRYLELSRHGRGGGGGARDETPGISVLAFFMNNSSQIHSISSCFNLNYYLLLDLLFYLFVYSCSPVFQWDSKE